MRVFVTGATGFVGSAVVRELVAAGHEVLGLARSDAGEAAVAAMGARALRGSLEEVDSLRRGVAATDGVIHTGFNHDFSRFAENCALDRRAIEAMGAEIGDTGRPMLVTSGVALAKGGPVGLESDTAVPPSDAFPRASEAAAQALAERGMAVSVVRLPPTTHGEGDHGFVPILIDIARRTGVSAYIGDGDNAWSATHRVDAARVYRLALERGASGGPFHAIAETGIPFREIATLIGRELGVPVESRSGDEAAAHFGWFAKFAGMNMAASGEHTQRLLGWKPEAPDLLTDMRQTYFATAPV
jgi:nucleoside-diphosphate-sugar epimerase